jgi:hypothetical protein
MKKKRKEDKDMDENETEGWRKEFEEEEKEAEEDEWEAMKKLKIKDEEAERKKMKMKEDEGRDHGLTGEPGPSHRRGGCHRSARWPHGQGGRHWSVPQPTLKNSNPKTHLIEGSSQSQQQEPGSPN